jgi:hypothetical protein
MLRVGQDLGIFGLLSKSKASLSVVQIAEKTNAAPELLGKLCFVPVWAHIYMTLK